MVSGGGSIHGGEKLAKVVAATFLNGLEDQPGNKTTIIVGQGIDALSCLRSKRCDKECITLRKNMLDN